MAPEKCKKWKFSFKLTFMSSWLKIMSDSMRILLIFQPSSGNFCFLMLSQNTITEKPNNFFVRNPGNKIPTRHNTSQNTSQERYLVFRWNEHTSHTSQHVTNFLKRNTIILFKKFSDVLWRVWRVLFSPKIQVLFLWRVCDVLWRVGIRAWGKVSTKFSV